MVTFDQLVTRAKDELGPELTRALDLRDDQLRAVLERIVRSSLHGMGFHVHDVTGEVCDPRPQPTMNYPYDQKRPRWTGSGRAYNRGKR